jgi:Tfp pilus assembly protein PilN
VRIMKAQARDTSMKEIDFLPEWYKSGRRRQVSYRTQYIALGGVFVVMVVWNFIAMHSISKVRAQFAQMSTKQAQAEGRSAELAEIQSELRDLQKKEESIEEIDSKIDVACVLAEMSFLIDEKIVLSKVKLVAEKFEDKQQAGTTVVRAVRTKLSEKREMPLGDVRFKVVIEGVAADATNLAALICRLEDSPYFCQVVPSFSRTAVINAAGNPSFRSTKSPNTKGSVQETGGNIRVSEFEVSCYLANYREQ